MLYKVLASRMCGGIASNLAASFGSQIKGYLIAMLLQSIFIEPLKDTAWLTAENTTDRIEALNFVHCLEADNNLIKERYTSAHESCVATLWNDSQVPGVTVPENLADLICLSGQKDHS
jgi:hypothetical protein